MSLFPVEWGGVILGETTHIKHKCFKKNIVLIHSNSFIYREKPNHPWKGPYSIKDPLVFHLICHQSACNVSLWLLCISCLFKYLYNWPFENVLVIICCSYDFIQVAKHNSVFLKTLFAANWRSRGLSWAWSNSFSNPNPWGTLQHRTIHLSSRKNTEFSLPPGPLAQICIGRGNWISSDFPIGYWYCSYWYLLIVRKWQWGVCVRVCLFFVFF